MVDASIVHGHIVARTRELTAEEAHLERRLRAFRGFSQIAVLGGIIVPMLAGSTLMAEGSALASYGPVIAIAVFITSALTALHKGLNCEAYHSECLRAIHELRSLVEGFQATVTLPADQVQAALNQLEARLQRYREHASDIPPRQSLRFIEQLFQLPGSPQVK
jgi:hypothetical protein